MRIIVTGAGGFVGKALLQHLAQQDVIAVDRALHGAPGIEGDIADPAVISRLFADGCDAVVHLATIGGGAAEADPATARRVNIEGTMALAEAAAALGTAPRFVFASSIAVFGDPLPPLVDDETPLQPRMLYGGHKAMAELWLETLTRRGDLRAFSMRLPGIVARPRGPSGLKSAFISDLFHALRAGETIELPVSAQATLWLMSVQRIAANIAHALKIEATGALTLPAVRCQMHELVAEVAAQAGQPETLARYAPDAALEAGFGRQPPLHAARAEALGFAADDDLAALVRAALHTLN